ncbi:MAG: LPS export ABC transporter ATP-binding protein, partial [Candidatus Coatesbacteria bacterium]|nr:LPS export ABC transporter ATP-binding protein [Candidatus Coatesbacteria bacterium]
MRWTSSSSRASSTASLPGATPTVATSRPPKPPPPTKPKKPPTNRRRTVSPQTKTDRQTTTPTEPKQSTLRTDGLVKSYRRRRVVDEVSIRVTQGEIVGLLGPNGAGKTTTFYQITGLIRPDQGRVYLDDRDITRVPMYKRARMGIGYLAQEPSIFTKLSVRDNIRAILETIPLSHEERKRELKTLLAKLDLTKLADKKAFTLSGGERRRVEITRALVRRPRFMLLDEPFAG